MNDPVADRFAIKMKSSAKIFLNNGTSSYKMRNAHEVRTAIFFRDQEA